MMKYLFLSLIMILALDSRLPGLEEGLECVSGDCENGKGRAAGPDGRTYEGDWKNGKYHGRGKSRSAGVSYSGQWRAGKRHGKGMQQCFEGRKFVSNYSGQWEDDRMHGRGVIFYADGSRYLGEFKDGAYHGKGRMIYPDKSKYEGEFRQGKEHGEGVRHYADGSRYFGQWAGGQREGEGTLVYADGARYKGRFQGGIPAEGSVLYDSRGRTECSGGWEKCAPLAEKHGSGKP